MFNLYNLLWFLVGVAFNAIIFIWYCNRSLKELKSRYIITKKDAEKFFERMNNSEKISEEELNRINKNFDSRDCKYRDYDEYNFAECIINNKRKPCLKKKCSKFK